MTTIGLLSDTHNAEDNVRRALEAFRSRRVTTLLHAGDLTREAVLHWLTGFDVWIARGNMDRDATLPAAADALLGAGRFQARHSMTIAGVTIALLHGDVESELRELIHSGKYAYVIHGHTHTAKDERSGATRVINPGALGSSGRAFGAAWPATCATLTLPSGELEWIEV